MRFVFGAGFHGILPTFSAREGLEASVLLGEVSEVLWTDLAVSLDLISLKIYNYY